MCSSLPPASWEASQNVAGKPEFYIGKRLSYEGALCTIRYFGRLAATKGSWLGVEWDDSSRGKHSGTHQGRYIFSCLSTSTTAASFVRPTRPSDSPRTFLEALKFKYSGKDADQLKQPVEFSGKIAEEVGFEKVRRQQAELHDLRIAVVDDIQVCGIAKFPLDSKSLLRAEAEIAQICPNIVELDLGWSLIETWQDVADICRPLKKLQVLKVCGVRLHSFDIKTQESSSPSFACVQEIHLSNTLLSPAQLAEMLNKKFPKLQKLFFMENELKSMSAPNSSQVLPLPNVSTLVLDKNAFTDLSLLHVLSEAFPNLQNLSLQQNLIEKMGGLNYVDMAKRKMCDNLSSLNVSGNKIKDFAFIDQLSVLFPNLASLRISDNPVYVNSLESASRSSTARSDASYSFILARIPSLNVLNYTKITTRDREEGEIYYLSAAQKDITALFETSPGPNTPVDVSTRVELAKRLHPRYEILCKKYERESVLGQFTADTAGVRTAAGQKYAASNVTARLVNATFSMLEFGDQVLHRSIPRTIDVYRLKALISREFRLRPLQFRLIYESEELDPVRDGMDQNSSDWETWGEWDVDEDFQNTQDSPDTKSKASHQYWADKTLLKDGKKWKKRETEILDGTRAWGDYIGDDEIKSVNIRVEPFDTT